MTPGGQGFDTVVFPETIGFGKDQYFDDEGNYLSDRLADENIGRITAALRVRGLAEDTLLIFTSDNGGTQQYTAPLNGSKGQLYEGGIRVPLVVAGAGVARPGSTCAVPVASIDVYPTLLEVTGAAIPNTPNPAHDPQAERPRGPARSWRPRPSPVR